MTPGDKSFLIWVSYDADKFYDENLVPKGIDVEVYTREEIHKVWDKAVNLLTWSNDGEPDMAQLNLSRACYVAGFVSGAGAARHGWPEIPLEQVRYDEGPR
jgi:hypothetical protein